MKKIKYILGIAIGFGLLSFTNNYFQISKNLDIFSAFFKQINTTYVDETDPSMLIRTGIDGMLKTIDPYTNYISESQIESYRLQNSEKITGFGLHFEMMDKIPVITDILKNLPAQKSGLQVGDKILAIDGKATTGKDKEEISISMRGQIGTTARLKIQTIAGVEKEIEVGREEFHETNVPFYGMLTKEIGYINLKAFNQDAAKDVKEAFEDLRKKNTTLNGLIIDLRGNPGGLLVDAVNIVNLFIEKNKVVVTTKGRVAEWNSTFKALNDPIDTKIPITVLTDSKSASASEIVSGSLQDYDRAIVVGQKTYGKGLVQVTKNLSYNTMLKVTTAKYYIPSGRCIQAIDYAEKNADGSVYKIPDSLKRQFTTANGRKVWDGGGVDPDVAIPLVEQPPLVKSLLDNHIVFDFVSQYKLAHPTIDSPAIFAISEKDFDDFVAFAKTKKYSYETETEKVLEKFQTISKEEKYIEAVEATIKKIEEKLKKEKSDIYSQKAILKDIIESQICGRYYALPGKIEKSLQNDVATKKAIELLKNPTKYNEILAGKK